MFTVRSERLRRKPRMNKCNIGTQRDICLWFESNEGGMDPLMVLSMFVSFPYSQLTKGQKIVTQKGFMDPINVWIYVKASSQRLHVAI